MKELVNVRINDSARVERCDPAQLELAKGDLVVVQTDHGAWLGKVLSKLRWSEERPLGEAQQAGLAKVLRRAEERDLNQGRACLRLEREAYRFCKERIAARSMAMNLTKVERALDGAKMTFYFTADGRVDFRALVKDLAGKFKCRVEMRQVGVRNETKVLGGVGGCGREICCASFMTDFTPVSVKMAKEQNLSLNPNKISGLCGRLMCCLAFEFPIYMECKKGMAKTGKRVEGPDGIGKVVRQNVMARRLTVNIGGKEYEYAAEEVAPAPPPQQQPSKKKAHRSGRSRSSRSSRSSRKTRNRQE